MAENFVTKSVVSVTEMAHMVGLSRARFYQLVRRGTFPPADQDQVSQRPCYCEEKQRLILEARRRNCGVDGKPVLFYSRRRDLGQAKAAPRPAKPKTKANNYADVTDLLAQVKITMTNAQVEAILKELFPKGTEGIDLGIIVDAIIDRTHRQNPAGSA
jgi:hypothetical protein